MTATSKEQAVETELQSLNLTAPRVTPEMIDAMIESTTFTLLQCKKMMVCQVRLNNGYTLLGMNTCVSPENFNLKLAEQFSLERAREQIWPLAGFLLAEDLYRGVNPLSEEQRKLPAHVQRVITEMFQVTSRLMGLNEFLNAYIANPAPYADIGNDEIADLKDQQGHMARYVAVLQRRLERAGV